MFQHGGLLGNIERLSEWMPKGQGQINRSRRPDSLGIVSDDGYPYGWNASSFNFPLNQSNGLVAQASARCQENGIDLILYNTGSDFRGIFIN